MQNKNLNKFFCPKSIAVVGATDGVGKVGTVVTRNILNLGYSGKVFLVNPKRTELHGKKCYAKLEDIEENIDLTVVVVPASLVVEIVKNGGDKAKNFIIISAGFSEIGAEGRKREEELKKIAEEKGLSILGPNCLGFLNPRIKLNATFAGGMPKRGNIGFVTQSGALAVAIMDIFARDQLGFSGVFSIGNKMQIGEADLIEYLGNNPDTKVIGLYLEGIKDGQKFMRIAKKISQIKPVVILKAGKTEKAQKVISSHTGALAGSDEVTSAVFEKCGIIRAQNLEEFIGILRLFSMARPPHNNSVAVITNAGGGGVLSTDAFHDKEMKLAELEKSVKEKLKSVLPPESSVENPIDVLGDAHEDRYENVLNIINGEKIGSILCILTPQEQTPVNKISEKIIDFSKNKNKTILTSFLGGDKIKDAVGKMRDSDIPNFEYPEKAIEALDKFFSRASCKKIVESEPGINVARASSSKKIISRAVGEKRKALLFSEAREMMKIYGINVVDTWNLNQAVGIKYPVAVKVDSDKILHKTDKEGIILGVKNHEELKRAVEKIKNYFHNTNIIIQSMSQGHQELIVGFKRDGIFGPVIAFGLGGIYTEVFRIVDLAVPPLGVKDAGMLIDRSKIKFLFKETRGIDAYNKTELAKIISNLGSIAIENPEIREFDINPLFVYNDGRKAVAADIKVII